MRSFFSFVLISLFGFAFLIGLVTFNLRETFLNASTIKNVLAENKVYENLVNETLPQFLGTLEGEEKGKPIFPEPLLLDLLPKVIEPQTLQTDVEIVVDNLVPYLESEQEGLLINIDLKKYKANLVDNLGPSAKTYVEGLSTCTDSTKLGDIKSIPTCRPQNATTAQVLQVLPINEAQDSLVKLPDEIIVDRNGFRFNPPLNERELSSVEEETEGFDFNNLRVLFRVAGFATLASLVFALLVLLLIMLLWWGKVYSGLKWVATALVSASILPVILATTMLVFLQKSVVQALLNSGPEEPPKYLESAYNYLGPFFRHFWTLVLFEAIGAIVLGIILFIASRYLEKKAKKA